MKKIFLWANLLLVTAAALLAVSCIAEELTEDAISGAVSVMAAPFVVFGICAAVIGMLVGLFFFIVWIIALVDCARRKPEEFPPGTGGENAKTMWLVILIVTFFVSQLNGIAAIVYYFMVMKKMPLKR
ncbi:MAG: hypothetical protein A2Z35_03895 [Actinobacteria bacterium RBG_19FT_COMBO_36_27]|nr:MAG: hypothetical protein A2Z35_03895 [Actinobacteria bacterium RBG_19FT_COMBO_36_27]